MYKIFLKIHLLFHSSVILKETTQILTRQHFEKQAQDKDTQPSITYMIRQGDTDKFQIDSKTGVIRTKRPLDFERQQQYILIIGTQENTDLNDAQGTTAVVVNVQDRNDVAPVFTSVPRPLRLSSNVQVGHTVTTVIAVDSDGTSPNNRLRYEVIGAGKAVQFFRVDPETGVVQTKDDLRKDMEREYKVITYKFTYTAETFIFRNRPK